MKTYFLFICAICCYLTGNAHSTEYNIFQLPKTLLSYKLKPSMPLLKIVTGKAEARLSFLQGFINQERFS